MMKTLFFLPLLMLACATGFPSDASLPKTTDSPGTNASPVSSQKEKNAMPKEVERCLESGVARGRIDLLIGHEPLYLAADFDADGRFDYALAVKGRASRRNGVLICSGEDRAVLLGADNATSPPFSDMPDDNFLAPEWEVLSRKEAEAIYNREVSPPTRAAYPKGDSIGLIWEDGIGVIWWDGSKFRWGCGQ